jgi:hypothetical protein
MVTHTRQFTVTLQARAHAQPRAHTYTLKVFAFNPDDAKTEAKRKLEAIGLVDVKPFACMYEGNDNA